MTIFLSALAALGLLTLCWIVFGLFLVPVGTIGSVHIRVLSTGDAEDLEHTLSGLCWLQRSGLLEGRIDVVDAGLSEEGRRRAIQLVKVHPGMHLISEE